MWVHARRWRVGEPAGSAGGRLGAHDGRSFARSCASSCARSCAPGPDFIYTIFSGGRVLDFIYKNFRGFCRTKALRFSREIKKNELYIETF